MTQGDNVIHMEYLKRFYGDFPTPSQVAMAQVIALNPSSERCQRTLDRLETCLEHIMNAEGAAGETTRQRAIPGCEEGYPHPDLLVGLSNDSKR